MCSQACNTPGGSPTLAGGLLRARHRVLCVTRMNHHAQSTTASHVVLLKTVVPDIKWCVETSRSPLSHLFIPGLTVLMGRGRGQLLPTPSQGIGLDCYRCISSGQKRGPEHPLRAALNPQPLSRLREMSSKCRLPRIPLSPLRRKTQGCPQW